VTYVVEVPQILEERSFDQFAAGFAGVGDAPRVLVDAHAASWASPAGLIGLLCAGQALAARGGAKPLLTVPADREVTHYWTRAGFFAHAADLFEIHGSVPRVKPHPERNVLLEVTPVTVADDVHAVVGRIQERSAAILTSELGLDPKATMGFGMALSEACQNIVEHAGTGGWVAVQRYNWRTIGRKVVVIAVADAGVGFRHTLEATQGNRFGDRWGDATALEAALIQGVSRFRDPGRGQGLAGIRRYLGRWHGKISIRSGTARIAIIPDWERDDEPLRDGLPPFPGAQVQLVVPEVEREAR
jgi:anti-sigma regulatory factor (Ser/Thr protein kinase)